MSATLDAVLDAVATEARTRSEADARLVALLRKANAEGASSRVLSAILRANGVQASHDTVNRWIKQQETRMRTLTIDATAGAVQAVLTNVFPGRIQPGIGGGRMVEVTLPEDDAETLAAELAARGYEYDVR